MAIIENEIKEKIAFEEINGDTFKIRLVEAFDNGKAALSHYLHHNTNGVSKYFKKDALSFLKKSLEYKYPEHIITSVVAENAMQHLLFEHNKLEYSFPPPEISKFLYSAD